MEGEGGGGCMLLSYVSLCCPLLTYLAYTHLECHRANSGAFQSFAGSSVVLGVGGKDGGGGWTDVDAAHVENNSVIKIIN